MKIQNILQGIGNTHHLRLNKLFPEHNVWIKLERGNPGGSIKDRIALNMITEAEKNGSLTKDTTIIEPTSGNTGVGLAMVAAAKGYKLILVMPESMSVERRKLMQAYGATFELTPRELGMKGAINKAQELNESLENSIILQQFNNEANTEIHRKTTAQEILADFDNIDYLITGVGTGGHISGVAEVLKEHYKNLKTYAVEPELSPVLSGGSPAPHPLQGIGAGFVPEILNTNILDKIVQVSKEEAFAMTQKIAATEGVLTGISTGASLVAVEKSLQEMNTSDTILTFNYDTGERYLSIDGLF